LSDFEREFSNWAFSSNSLGGFKSKAYGTQEYIEILA